MSMLPKAVASKHAKGQADHVDAWLISYADLITLLFAFIVIIVSVTATSRHHQPVHELTARTQGEEPKHPYAQGRYGTLVLQTPYDETYRSLVGVISQNRADQNIAVEQGAHSLWIDIAAGTLFARGAADISTSQLQVLQQIAQVLQQGMQKTDAIAVEGYTDDEPVQGALSNNWELAALRASRVAGLLAAEGIDASRLHVTGYANNRPLVPNTDAVGQPIPENRNTNQRIVIRIERPQETVQPE